MTCMDIVCDSKCFWRAFGTLLLSHYCRMKQSVSLRAPVQRGGGGEGSIWWLRLVTPSGRCLWNCACLYSIYSPFLELHINHCHRPKQRCHLTILGQIWKLVYLHDNDNRTLKEDVMSRQCAVKKWSIGKNEKESQQNVEKIKVWG